MVQNFDVLEVGMEKMKKNLPNFPRILIFDDFRNLGDPLDGPGGATKQGEILGLGLGQKA